MPSDDQSTPASTPSLNLRVLLVDDQDDLLLMMNLMLKRHGLYTVETASSGAQAMQKAPGFSPHVVISDIGMPDMDGYELMKNLRRLEGGQISPFKAIALSGYDVHHDINKSGYDAHLTKPVDFEVLIQTLDRIALDVKKQELKSND